MRFTYDNSDGNPRNPNHPARAIHWGPQSSDEMGALWLEVLPRHAEDVGLFMRDNAARAMRADIGNAELQVQNRPDDALARNFLAAKYLQAGRVPDAVAQLDEALRLKPDDAEAHSNLGIAFQLQNRIADAAARTADRRAPQAGRRSRAFQSRQRAAGRPDSPTRPSASIAARSRSIRTMPTRTSISALVLGPQGKLDEAVAHFRRALADQPSERERPPQSRHRARHARSSRPGDRGIPRGAAEFSPGRPRRSRISTRCMKATTSRPLDRALRTHGARRCSARGIRAKHRRTPQHQGLSARRRG